MSYTVAELNVAMISWDQPADLSVEGHIVSLNGVDVKTVATPVNQIQGSYLGVTTEGVYTLEVRAYNSTGLSAPTSLILTVANLPLPTAPTGVVVA